LTLLAGGLASEQLQAIMQHEGIDGITDRLGWMGRVDRATELRSVSWERDRFAGGGYAFFDRNFLPEWRDELGRKLIALQHADGYWVNTVPDEMQDNKVVVTAFTMSAIEAILQ